MTSVDEVTTLKALLRKSLATIKELNRDAAQRGSTVSGSPETATSSGDPIAIIGDACELPGGATTPEAYWSLLSSDKDCVRDAPASPWLREFYHRYFQEHPAAAGYARANYLDGDVMRFDPRHFAISPTEARDMDPAQRMALTLTARALERAGYHPRRIDGRVGVYFGVIGGEYGALARRAFQAGGYVATGTLNSVVSGRASHTFDFDGPAISVDTACSSSLVALHLACEGIRGGDCDIAVVGGINLLLDPSSFTVLAGVGAVSPDGRCHAFSGDGEGYGRGEGGGVVVLKRLSAARRDRDQVLAVVRATAINHDGTCSGLTVPNGRAQGRLIEAALRRSGLAATDIDYLEAHGTGTPLGDPIEMTAASQAYCRDRPADRPLVVGSVKALIGHLEAASGIASLLKLIMVLRHRRVPAQPMSGPVNRNIDFDGLRLRVPTAPVDLPAPSGRALTGAISSFGFSGTNAHVIVSAPDPEPPRPPATRVRHALLLAAGSRTALDTCVADAVADLERVSDATPVLEAANGPSIAEDMCFTRATGREHGPYRTYVTGTDRAELLAALRAQQAVPQFVTDSGLTRNGPLKRAVLLDGHAPPDSWSRDWHRTFAAFRAGFDRVAAGTSLARLLEPGEQPADAAELAGFRLAVLCGTVALWRGFGVVPEIWCAAGIGVYAAAVESGTLPADAALADLATLFADVSLDTDGDLPALAGLRVPEAGHGGTGRLDAALVDPLDGGFVGPSQLADPTYWLRAATAPADLGRGARRCAEHDVRVAVAVHPPGPSIAEALVVVAPAPGDDPRDAVLSVLLRLYELGADVDWEPLYAGSTARRVTLSTTPLDEAPYVLADPVIRPVNAVEPVSGDPLEPRPHLSPRSGGEIDFTLGAPALPLADTHHIVHIGYFVEMLLRSVALLRPDTAFQIREMRFSTALVVWDTPARVRLVLEESGDSPAFAFYSLVDEATNRWQQHVSGTLARQGDPPVAAAAETGPPTRLLSGAEFYAKLAERGLRLGPSVRAVGDVYTDGTGVLADVEPAHAVAPQRALARVAPGILDAGAQVFQMAMPPEVPPTAAFMVEALEGLLVHAGGLAAPARLRVDGVRAVPGDNAVTGRLLVLDARDEVIVECARCTVRWIEGGVESILAAAGLAGDEPRLTDAEIADPDRLPDAVMRVLSVLTGVPASDIRGGETTTALGVDSLQATRLHRALEPVNPSDRVPLADIVAGIGVAELARRLRGDTNETRRPAAAAPVRRRNFLQLSRQSPRLRLLCVPYGGGSTLVFQGWQAFFPDDVEVCPVSLPGRGDRLGEPLVPDVYQLVDDLEEEVLRSVDTPFVLYGHSFGALIGYLLGLRLQARGLTSLRHLCVGAFSSPGGRGNPFQLECLAEIAAAGYPGMPSTEDIQALDTDDLRRLAAILRFPLRPAMDRSFLRMALPVLVNDIRLVGSFRHEDAVPLDVPITAVHGSGDDRVEEQQMRDWKRWTTRDLDFHVLDGDHFFLHPDQQRAALLDILVRGPLAGPGTGTEHVS